ncbi:unnamed protein product [[Candida] boidinii]|uniref:Unnamed protein product n=1 Tax=Candida boidinii TaxID=5477 RepID=A0ACB5TZ27_CANBO|nr:unnamed protein product [[Candida] boidinii]
MESKTDDLYGHDIPKRLQKANTKLKSLVTLYDKDIIKSNISKYTYRNLGHDSSETDIISDLNSNQLLDQKYSLQLEVLKKLWIINGLVNELSPLKTLKDTDGSETQSDDNQNNSSINFSHAVYNYIKLKLKVSELVAYLKTGNFMGNSISEKDINEIRILSDLESNINEFESRIFVLIQIQFKKFIKIDNEEVSVMKIQSQIYLILTKVLSNGFQMHTTKKLIKALLLILMKRELKYRLISVNLIIEI